TYLSLPSFPTRRSSDLPLGAGRAAQGAEDRDVQVQAENGGTEPLLSRVQEIEIIAEGVSPVIDEGVQGGQRMALGQFQFELPLRSEEHTSELQSRENLV